MKTRIALCAALLALTPATQAACNAFAPYSLPYRVSYGSTPLGTGSLSVFPSDDAGCYVFRLLATPYAALRWAVGGLEEESRFCVRGSRIQPQRFHHLQEGDDKSSYALSFDWAARKVSGGRFGSAPLEGDALDSLSLQLHVRDWVCRHGEAANGQALDVSLVDRRGVQRYRLEITARETIEVPAGHFDTLRIERTDSKRSTTRFWLAREHDYLIVRAQQRREDKPAVRIELAQMLAH